MYMYIYIYIYIYVCICIYIYIFKIYESPSGITFLITKSKDR